MPACPDADVYAETLPPCPATALHPVPAETHCRGGRNPEDSWPWRHTRNARKAGSPAGRGTSARPGRADGASGRAKSPGGCRAVAATASEAMPQAENPYPAPLLGSTPAPSLRQTTIPAADMAPARASQCSHSPARRPPHGPHSPGAARPARCAPAGAGCSTGRRFAMNRNNTPGGPPIRGYCQKRPPRRLQPFGATRPQGADKSPHRQGCPEMD